ncbi:DUF2637 domain-containing protein [Streptomyces sp. E5N91]|uniref:DUF2637 domain-containing protein n=1 Tax=Streptomyces sp. E5N91 TaxID=1851996 RepID=UPI000EF5A889|nr:DUF2637 domain-containing protein [Streptomyces sp. E5N91]
MSTTPTRALAIAAGLVIVALTAAAFWLSYAHLAEVALAHGMQDKEIRAWAWPATLDLFIVAGELLMLRAALNQRADWWAIGLTVAGSGGSIVLNVAGVGSHAEPLDYVVAAVPPTAALLAFGALMRQIHQALAPRVDVPAAAAEEPATAPAPEPEPEAPAPAVAARPLPEAVPAGARMLPIVTRPEPDEVTTDEPLLQPGWDQADRRFLAADPVTSPAQFLDFRPLAWPPDVTTEPRPTVTASVPAETGRQVVTETIIRTPTELRREARRLNREAVRSTNRPVTIKTLQDVLGLSRREATDLRREIVEGARS